MAFPNPLKPLNTAAFWVPVVVLLVLKILFDLWAYQNYAAPIKHHFQQMKASGKFPEGINLVDLEASFNQHSSVPWSITFISSGKGLCISNGDGAYYTLSTYQSGNESMTQPDQPIQSFGSTLYYDYFGDCEKDVYRTNVFREFNRQQRINRIKSL